MSNPEEAELEEDFEDILEEEEELKPEAEATKEAEPEAIEEEDEEDEAPEPEDKIKEVYEVVSDLQRQQVEQFKAQILRDIANQETTLKYTELSLKKQLEQATTDGDYEKALQITQEFANVATQMSQLDAKKKNIESHETNNVEVRQFEQARDIFMKKNSWYATDEDKRETADALFDAMCARGIKPVEALKLVESKMSKVLGVQKRTPKEAPKVITKKPVAPVNPKSFANLKKDAQDAFKDFYKNIGDNSLSQKEAWSMYKQYLTPNDYRTLQ